MFALLFSLLIGCQSYRSAVGIICHAPTDCTSCRQTDDVSKRRELLANHVQGRVRNDQALQLLESFRTMSPSLRSQTLASEANRFGYETCPLATELKD